MTATSKSEKARVAFLGLDFDPLSLNEAAAAVERMSAEQQFAYVVTPNVDHVVRLHSEPILDDHIALAYCQANLVLCDSRILSALGKRSGKVLPVAPGSDLTSLVLQRAAIGRNLSVVGGSPEMHRRLERLYPMHSWRFSLPPMGVRYNPAARAEICQFVESSSADMIFFAIGAPQSELICREIALRGNARGVALCTGASLEFITGLKMRSPRWMQAAHIEWLHRLLTEPRRLWRRYLVEGPRIFWIWWGYQRATTNPER
ncbi:WecB/TagA/CpsF family glycosyltransferase [Tsuneonella amylolytica]|uniref:WecB/TagA/CpsF family glycosyltransferase n=1 Tax=Tsuneonella amylolytica TaxID=2338327 RepID=UPI000EA8E758|nr:WecB/TagA/CpsF family glycosyltransferase [Tsuneonella amylolytica]